MATDSGVAWPPPSSGEASEVRLPSVGDGDPMSGLVAQQHKQHEGFPKGFDDEWGLIDEMKELSSAYPHNPHHHSASSSSQQEQHEHQQEHRHQQQLHFRTNSFGARRFSSFLEDEPGFMGDFCAAAASGLLEPPPPLLAPVPPPPHAPPLHRPIFNVGGGGGGSGGGGDMGLLDFGGGAAAWTSPNFGSFGVMGGGSSRMIKGNGGIGDSCFAPKAAQQHTGSGQSSPSTMIKSPNAFPDSSLEIGGDEAATMAAGGRRKKKGGGGGGGVGGGSPTPPGDDGGQPLDGDGREDEEMDDASGLLCENDEAMGGVQAPVPVAGKGNRKGLPAKNLMAERRRRKKLNDRLYMLRSVVPRITKMDRASILGDAIEYLKELLQRINELHNELECPGDVPLGPSDPSASSLSGMLTQHPPPPPPPPPPPLLLPGACVKEECGAAAAAAPPPQPQPQEAPKVNVRNVDGKTINIHMFCARRPGLLLSTMRALDGLGLDVQQAVISCFNGFVLDVFRAEQCREGEIPPEEIKSALLQTAEAISS